MIITKLQKHPLELNLKVTHPMSQLYSQHVTHILKDLGLLVSR